MNREDVADGRERTRLALRGALAVPLLALVQVACDGTGASVELEIAQFQVHECGNERFGPLFTDRQAAEYAGLRCIAWELGEDSALIDLINFRAACGFEGFEDETLWVGRGTQPREDLLQLIVEWDFEEQTGCPACEHDFSFEFASRVEAESLDVEIATRSCTGNCDWLRQSAALPVGESPAGNLCRYVPSHASTRDPRAIPLGTLHARSDDGQCESGLAPIEVEDGLQICAATCSTDSDCPLSDVLACEDGVCRIAQPWEP
jgi:hypothetical protein